MQTFKGIDISVHNGFIDFNKVKNSGIDFVMIRLGFGSDTESQDDSMFEQNVAGCEASGLKWGAYLYSYALNVQDAKSEAEHALRLLKDKNPSLPIAFDMEDADGYKSRKGVPDNQTLIKICKTFLDTLEAAGYQVYLYACLNWLENKLNDYSLDKYSKWVAQWNDKCTYGKPYDMWQYSSNGLIDGISGRVDMNLLYNYDLTSSTKNPTENGRKSKEDEQATYKTYTVKSGDTLYGIASKYNMDLDMLVTLNPQIKDPNLIYPGQKINISAKKSTENSTYIVARGDTIWGISESLLGSGGRYSEIKAANGLTGDTIYPGQVLVIPR